MKLRSDFIHEHVVERIVNKYRKKAEVIMRKVKLTKESTKDILETLLKRSPNNYGKYEDAVADILAKVKAEGDEALFAFTREFDKVEVTKETIRVTPEEIEEAYKLVDPSLIDVIKKALVNIRSYHEKQLQNSWFTSTTDGTMLGQKVTALNRVGVYVPGGKAVYPSSVLMNIVPAKVAGVDRIFDMGRTVVNITGDASCCVVVHNLEKKKEMKKN